MQWQEEEEEEEDEDEDEDDEDDDEACNFASSWYSQSSQSGWQGLPKLTIQPWEMPVIIFCQVSYDAIYIKAFL